ncbi:MAG: SOS response-associated peptidase [Reichenbachiella sp.]|uniref:SOS response-associated peptidase n=1 Tax=Reichenbachiella sp. TaxID=2184521 RepID=UPI00329974B7
MCGRYVIVTKINKIEKRFNVEASDSSGYQPNVNVSHGNMAPVITNDKPNELQFFMFGFSPSWASKLTYIVNARAEGDQNKENDPKYSGGFGIIRKPMFRQAIRSTRCLIPADCFIEGSHHYGLSKPYAIYKQNGDRPFSFAGIWDEWVDKSTGEVFKTFAIITTMSNTVTQAIGHPRSPVMLSREEESIWLSNDSDLNEITTLLKPYPGDELNAYPISAAIKSPTANGMDLLRPVGQRLSKEYDYEIYNVLEVEGMGESKDKKRFERGTQGNLFD